MLSWLTYLQWQLEEFVTHSYNVAIMGVTLALLFHLIAAVFNALHIVYVVHKPK